MRKQRSALGTENRKSVSAIQGTRKAFQRQLLISPKLPVSPAGFVGERRIMTARKTGRGQTQNIWEKELFSTEDHRVPPKTAFTPVHMRGREAFSRESVREGGALGGVNSNLNAHQNTHQRQMTPNILGKFVIPQQNYQGSFRRQNLVIEAKAFKAMMGANGRQAVIQVRPRTQQIITRPSKTTIDPVFLVNKRGSSISNISTPKHNFMIQSQRKGIQVVRPFAGGKGRPMTSGMGGRIRNIKKDTEDLSATLFGINITRENLDLNSNLSNNKNIDHLKPEEVLSFSVNNKPIIKIPDVSLSSVWVCIIIQYI